MVHKPTKWVSTPRSKRHGGKRGAARDFGLTHAQNGSQRPQDGSQHLPNGSQHFQKLSQHLALPSRKNRGVETQYKVLRAQNKCLNMYLIVGACKTTLSRHLVFFHQVWSEGGRNNSSKKKISTPRQDAICMLTLSTKTRRQHDGALDTNKTSPMDAKPAGDPGPPTTAEIAKHAVSHWPHRSWCSHCIRERGRSRQHRTDGGSKRTKPVLQCRLLLHRWRNGSPRITVAGDGGLRDECGV